MTSSEPSSTDSASRASLGSASGDAVAGVQTTLATEHAAVWAYRLVTAFLPSSSAEALSAGLVTHRAQRDGAERLVRDAGATPVPAAPGYVGGATVTDEKSALTLLVTVESDVATAWRGVLERTDDRGLRRTALDALVGAAVRATAWRQQAGDVPASEALPGAKS
ncbi:MAG: ferritin-like domain-containing protein [Sciscionella sp.]